MPSFSSPVNTPTYCYAGTGNTNPPEVSYVVNGMKVVGRLCFLHELAAIFGDESVAVK